MRGSARHRATTASLGCTSGCGTFGLAGFYHCFSCSRVGFPLMGTSSSEQPKSCRCTEQGQRGFNDRAEMYSAIFTYDAPPSIRTVPLTYPLSCDAKALKSTHPMHGAVPSRLVMAGAHPKSGASPVQTGCCSFGAHPQNCNRGLTTRGAPKSGGSTGKTGVCLFASQS